MCGRLQDVLFIVDDRLRVEERNAVEFEQRVVERVRDVVADPLGHHDGDHERQQERHVVRDLDLHPPPDHSVGASLSTPF